MSAIYKCEIFCGIGVWHWGWMAILANIRNNCDLTPVSLMPGSKDPVSSVESIPRLTSSPCVLKSIVQPLSGCVLLACLNVSIAVKKCHQKQTSQSVWQAEVAGASG